MTKASMTLASINASPLADVSDAVVSTRQWRRLVARRRRERRGIILIFVVVLLMLLAIMGTAYLASSRADRVAIVRNGAVAGTTTPRLADRSRLDQYFEATQDRVKTAVIEDLFNVAPGDLVRLQRDADRTLSQPIATARLQAAFRQDNQPAVYYGPNLPNNDLNVYYHNYDAPGRADPYLASLLPEKLPNVPTMYGAFKANQLVWPWISAPLRGEILPGVATAPFFADPRYLDSTAPPANYGFANINGLGSGVYAQQIDVTDPNSKVPTNTTVYPQWNTQVTERANMVVESIPMLRSGSTNIALESAKTTRVYPAFALSSNFADRVLAGDADGDGIADCGLMPLILNTSATNLVDRYVDTENGVVYFVGYRVVDNSAQININTALTAKGDFESLATAVPSPTNQSDTTILRNRIAFANPDAPNLGLFRSNVGLSELVRNSLEPFGTTATSPMITELQRLSDARFPQVGKANGSEASPLGANTEFAIRRIGVTQDPNYPAVTTKALARYYIGLRDDTTTLTTPTQAWYYRFSTFGDLLEQQLARRTSSPGPLRSGAGALNSGALVSLPVADTVSFAASGGTLLNPRITTADGENALLLSTRVAAPNFSANGEEPWKWFPPANSDVWFGWSKDFGATVGATTGATVTAPTAGQFVVNLLDGAANTRQYAYNPGATASAAGTSAISLAKPLRSLLTTQSGVTYAVPKRYLNGAELPLGMPDYGDETSAQLTYPAVKVSAATGTKEQLWRAYWSAMTESYFAPGGTTTRATAPKDLYDGRNTIPTTASSSATHYYEYGGTEMQADPYAKAYEAFQPPDRHPNQAEYAPGTLTLGVSRAQVRLKDEQVARIRSAVAACNTIDLRDQDNDITAMTVDLGESFERNLAVGTPTTNPRNEMYARVYGTEKQLVVSGAVIDRAGGAVYVAVELFNPSNEPLRLDGYYVGVADRSASLPAATTLDNGIITMDPAGPGPAVANARLMQAGVPATIAPGGFVILATSAAPPTGIIIQPPSPAIPANTASNPPKATDETPPSTAPPQVIVLPPMAGLAQLALADRELVLLRTRRADGVAFTDNPAVETNNVSLGKNRRPRFNEALTAISDLASLVPIDAVDFRTTTAAAGDSRYWYLRSTTSPNYFTADKYAWREFYAGKFFETRPNTTTPEVFAATAGGGTTPATVTATTLTAQTPAIRPAADWAWREYLSTGPMVPAAATGTLGAYREPAVRPTRTSIPTPGDPNEPGAGSTTALPNPFYAPTIPIQNTRPLTAFDPASATPYNPVTLHVGVPAPIVDHAPFQFPYGSPFARNADVLGVPFIGSYKIYRVQITGDAPVGSTASTIVFPGASATTPPAEILYEYVPLPMDAVNVAPFSQQWRQTNGATLPGVIENGSVGRFDPRLTILPRNDWAAHVLDYVSARESESTKVKSPDVPVVTADAANRVNDAMVPSTDQDGPVVGYSAPYDNNDRADTPWVGWYVDTTTGIVPHTPVSYSRAPSVTAGSGSGSLLMEGTINLNTAPPIVLRMLPWTVSPTTGQLDQSSAGASNQEQRWRTGVIGEFLNNPLATTPTVPTGRLHADRNEPPFALSTIFAVSDLRRIQANDPSLATAPTVRTAVDEVLLDVSDPTTGTPGTPVLNMQLMRLGMLNPQYRSWSTSDFEIQHLNAKRISNLASQRSDVFTVYVTVQAWTYVANSTGTGTPAAKQFAGTRLVGERRGSFVVDRSRISQTAFKPSDLIVYPVEQE